MNEKPEKIDSFLPEMLKLEAFSSQNSSAVIKGEELDTFFEVSKKLDKRIEGVCCEVGSSSRKLICGAGDSCKNRCGRSKENALIVFQDENKKSRALSRTYAGTQKALRSREKR